MKSVQGPQGHDGLAYEPISIPKSNSPHLQSHEWDESNGKLGVRNVRRICVSSL